MADCTNTRPGTKEAAEEAQAYADLLKIVADLAPDGAKLALAIDDSVGARLALAEDEAVIRALRTREIVLRREADGDTLFSFPVTAVEGDGDESRYDTATPTGRYLSLADRIAGLGPKAERLVNRLDSAVHERLAEARDGGAVEVIALRRDLEDLRRQLERLRTVVTSMGAIAGEAAP